MANADAAGGFVRVADADAVREAGRELVTLAGQAIALFHHEGAFHAVDNRCPHMGFPLSRGTVEDGVLTCHWHHARFELSCGDTFDPFADDVRTFPVEEREGDLYVDPDPPTDEPPAVRWERRLEDGLRENLSLVVAKSVIGLDDAGVDPAVPLGVGARFGTHYNDAGWGRGLTTMVALANLLPDVREADRPRALYHGLRAVASDCSGQPPLFVQEPFDTDAVGADRLRDWFRETVEVRDADGAERVLRTAIRADLPEAEIARMVFAAATDHRYLDAGHRLDFANKAFELLDVVGADRADEVLPSLVPGLASADRAEERSSWRQPVDVAGLLEDAFEDLPDLAPDDSAASTGWTEPDGFQATLLDDDPAAIVDALLDAVADGASVEALAGAVADAAARRVAQFSTGNEFGDWNTVHHTFTYAHAVHAAARRAAGWELYRGAFDAAVNVYLDRFLNTPPAPVPAVHDDPRAPDAVLEALEEPFEVEGAVDRAGGLVAEFVDAGGDPADLQRLLGRVLLREDADFHTRQAVEAGFAHHAAHRHAAHDHHAGHDDDARARVALVAAGRYLAAHTPTRRSAEQTFHIADRLHRGEALHEAAASPADD